MISFLSFLNDILTIDTEAYTFLKANIKIAICFLLIGLMTLVIFFCPFFVLLLNTPFYIIVTDRRITIITFYNLLTGLLTKVTLLDISFTDLRIYM